MKKRNFAAAISVFFLLGCVLALPDLKAFACSNVYDGRLNNSPAIDCAAPVVLYRVQPDENGMGFVDIYGVGNGQSNLLLHLPSILWEIAPPARDKTLLRIVGNPNNGQPIGVYLMLNGEVLIESNYADGKPYVLRYDPDGAVSILPIAW
ncbi:MAG: hypothetical protein ABI700_19075 [Chloroflexota bacterium]